MESGLCMSFSYCWGHFAENAWVISLRAFPRLLTLVGCLCTISATSLGQVEVAQGDPFYVFQDSGTPAINHFVPSGIMGDTGDVAINEAWSENPHSGKTCIRIKYESKGRGPSYCDDYAPPCKWAGVYWLEPANNWGKDEKLKDAGYDLSAYTVLRFWARTDTKCSGVCVIKFTVGGIDHRYGDSLKCGRSVKAKLTDKWCPFEIDLKNANLHHIVGGFSFAVAQRDYPSGLTVYLDDIRFEKK